MKYSSEIVARYKKSWRTLQVKTFRKNEALRKKALSEARRLAGILARTYDVTRVILFGSTIGYGDFSPQSDIDLAVSDLKPEDYFRAVGQLLFESRFPVDLIDSRTCTASMKKRITRGKVLYEKQSPA